MQPSGIHGAQVQVEILGAKKRNKFG